MTDEVKLLPPQPAIPPGRRRERELILSGLEMSEDAKAVLEAALLPEADVVSFNQKVSGAIAGMERCINRLLRIQGRPEIRMVSVAEQEAAQETPNKTMEG